MTPAIRSHVFENGLVLVAEPMMSLESAAFTFLLPAGSAYDPLDRSGLSSFACEMALRGSGERDSRKFVEDLDSLGVEHGESVSSTSHPNGISLTTLSRPAFLNVTTPPIPR